MSKPSLPYQFFLSFNHSLHVFEKPKQIINTEDTYAPVFILGAPRSGTTLFYQALLSEFGFSYFSNLHCKLFGMPWLIEKFSNYKTQYQKNTSFTSKFGNTSGWFSPSECGDYWYRFFRKKPQHVSLDDVDQEKLLELKKSFSILQGVATSPFVFKNLMCSLRLEPILKIFPNAIFLVLDRNEVDTAHSILESRYKLYQDYETWFSLEPPNIKELSTLPAEAQVIEQIRATYKLINDQRKKIPDQFCTINYEEFCNSPKNVMQMISEFLSKHEITVTQQSRLPDSFKIRREVRIDPELYSRLEAYISENPNAHE